MMFQHLDNIIGEFHNWRNYLDWIFPLLSIDDERYSIFTTLLYVCITQEIIHFEFQNIKKAVPCEPKITEGLTLLKYTNARY